MPRSKATASSAPRRSRSPNEYIGTDRRNGGFLREVLMTEGCFAHLQQHAVLLNETTIRQIRDPATALDLYIWLAYRLRRLDPKCPVALSWQQFATHFGNEAWDRVGKTIGARARDRTVPVATYFPSGRMTR